MKILTGEDARKAVAAILEGGECDGKSLHYPVLVGSVGYFLDKSGFGQDLYSAFDNSTGDCWCEDFTTKKGAELWCQGKYSADEVRQMESEGRLGPMLPQMNGNRRLGLDDQTNQNGHFNVDTIILTEKSFEALKGEFGQWHPLPPYVAFDDNGEFQIEMEFHDGYARDLNPHGLGMYDRTALYYPTVKEIEGDKDKQNAISHYTGRVWSEGSYQDKIFDIALKYGEASRLHCPKYRYDDAVKAVVERTVDKTARAFTPEQRERILLAAACNGEPEYSGSFREVFYEQLHAAARREMWGINNHWIQDSLDELKDLSNGKVRDEGVGLHR